MPILSLRGIDLRYRVAGEDRPSAGAVVFLHGAGASSLVWLASLRVVQPLRRGAAIDLPGHGRSPGPARTSIAGYADGAVAAVRALAAAPAILVGHSMGGAIALAAALAAPADVAGLVLAATGARLPISPRLLHLIEHEFPKFPRFLAREGFSSATSPARAELLLRDLIQAKRETVLADFRACAAFDARARLCEIRCPTLVIAGAEDRLAPPDLSAELAAGISGSHLVTLSAAGHMVMHEQPRAYQEALLEFIRSLPAAS